ncbi:MAG TPA: SDR family oxidoreductase [Blastocatellia bacterium]|nr:SDR family oxidoreductase [Blastocatellia bacterium]
MSETYFITGAQGCIGSWIVKELVERGDTPVIFDVSDDARRLRQIMSEDEIAAVRFIVGDITDSAAVASSLAAANARRIIHLAGLQVPTCKADPVRGAMVNVVGTLNVFEAARQAEVERVVYASSAAVFGLSEDDAPVDETSVCEPATHYGVFKRANEGNARVYYLDHGLSSAGLRPLTVYGVNRDFGLTSDPTKAMKAAVLGVPFHIRFGGATDFLYVADAAAAFIACADRAPAGAHVFNLHGETVMVDEVVRLINEAAGRELATFGGPPIPIAAALSDAAIRRTIGELPVTSLVEGVRETMRRFVELRAARRLDTGDIEAEMRAAGV